MEKYGITYLVLERNKERKFIFFWDDAWLTLITNLRSQNKRCMTSGFRREEDENCALQSYGAANSGNSLPTSRDKTSVPSSWILDP
jgi:hypothetical protein